jgi:hypothetical protein
VTKRKTTHTISKILDTVIIGQKQQNQNTEFSVKRNQSKLMLGFKISLENPLDALQGRPNLKFQACSVSQKELQCMNAYCHGVARNVCTTTGITSGTCCDMSGFLFMIYWPTDLLTMLWVKSSTEEVDVRSSSLFCCSG